MRLSLLAALIVAASAWGANTATVVSAATFRAGALAPESIASAFGSSLATTAQSASSTALPTSLGGTQVTVRDSAGASRAATLYYVSASQVNFVIPAGAAAGAAAVTITSGDGTVSSAEIAIAPVAPALFLMNGTVAAIAVLVKADGSQTSSLVTATPIDPGGPGDSLVLALYGTGIRGRGSLDNVTCTIGGSVAPVLYAGPQTQYAGLDQVNVLAPRNLGSQTGANVLLMVDSTAANPVRIAMEPRPLGDTRPRAAAIVGQMTLDEKIASLHGIQDATHYRTVPGVPRLGVPALNITNGPAGVTNGGPGHQGSATALPAPVALAATWDIGLARLYGSIVGLEARNLANGFLEGPDINIVRVPQNGRAFEAYGEDPYLAGQISASFIQGVQSEGVIAEAKHYAGNNQETNRGTIDDLIDERTLREIYLPAFEASVQGGVDGVMCAYNKVNGAYSCENDLLMNQILKNEWGFGGFITSDFGAVHSTVPSANAGLDVEMPTGIYFTGALQSAVQSGAVPMASIDDKLVRRYSTMMRYGIFDAPPANQPLPTGQDGVLARRIAEAGMVLLKNDGGILPLNASRLRSIAVIGPYAAKAKTGGGGSSLVVPAYTVDPVPAIQARAGPGVTVTYASGSDIPQAAAMAKAADVAILMIGDDETEGSDHPITMTLTQILLVTAIAAANPKTVVVVKSGSALLIPVESVPAILEAWYPGEEDGNAVAAVLFGDYNPSGKLPVTFPQTLADLPANTPEQYPGVNGVANYSEGVFVGYRHFDTKGIQPLFPFGHGLSYTSFAYRNLAVVPVRSDSGQTREVLVTFTVTNTGSVAGAEAAQVYVGMPSTSVPQPPKQLKAFSKVFLQPGESASMLLTLDLRAFSYWDVATHGWKIAPGTYQILVGSSSRDIRLQGQVTF